MQRGRERLRAIGCSVRSHPDPNSDSEPCTTHPPSLLHPEPWPWRLTNSNPFAFDSNRVRTDPEPRNSKLADRPRPTHHCLPNSDSLFPFLRATTSLPFSSLPSSLLCTPTHIHILHLSAHVLFVSASQPLPFPQQKSRLATCALTLQLRLRLRPTLICIHYSFPSLPRSFTSFPPRSHPTSESFHSHPSRHEPLNPLILVLNDLNPPSPLYLLHCVCAFVCDYSVRSSCVTLSLNMIFGLFVCITILGVRRSSLYGMVHGWVDAYVKNED